MEAFEADPSLMEWARLKVKNRDQVLKMIMISNGTLVYKLPIGKEYLPQCFPVKEPILVDWYQDLGVSSGQEVCPSNDSKGSRPV